MLCGFLLRQGFSRISAKKSSRNYYMLLNLSPKASFEQIKQAYINLARKLHPDVNKDEKANLHFQALNEAYVVLSNYAQRRSYDAQHGFNNNQTKINQQFQKQQDQQKPINDPFFDKNKQQYSKSVFQQPMFIRRKRFKSTQYGQTSFIRSLFNILAKIFVLFLFFCSFGHSIKVKYVSQDQ